MQTINIAKEVILLQSKEILRLLDNLTDDFEKAVEAVLNTSGKLIVSGMGKSGIIGKKIAATLASTGTPSFFLHPGEAYHGDLGMIGKDDIVLLISYSGETDEILKLIPFLKSQKNKIIGISGNPNSTLAQNSNFHLNIHINQEACPLQLAPTTSTTATLVMGDALAIALMKARDFKEQDFAKFHPGGSLGKRLLTNVESIMKKDNLPICKEQSDIKDIIYTITKGQSGLVAILDNNVIKGIITDGDIRRAMEKYEKNFFELIAKDIMTYNPKTILKPKKLVEANEMMNRYKINSLLVVDEKENFVGIVQMYDL